ncbi:zinc-dependent alcohol dehydrogenase family protein [Limosilactobacillus sp.]|uniref:zinc-dependent alcohol dehydrogenase family protein n=1 Tax=Limosilactobacillus sp. TaxID=2773925 RepID=UPI0025C61BAC|nr:zinc-dependent alcohol dehydrogenase family protein [Limosilactobacillus sp.]MCH3921607.1 zinc-dependent alcohol dehydrogenase family protein [Limosilactobacillus sp.]MCH3928378.1 zinc-dependent alcohol dehydrogenase family protein [Limosilactobacillus sp.]
MSKMLRVHQFGSVAGVQLDDIEVRQPGADEARIKVAAAGISGDQLNFIKGRFLPGQPVPETPASLGYEAAGVVTAVGPNVDSNWVGKRVAPIGPYDFLKYGSFGEEIIVPADRLAEIPDQLPFDQAAALWVPYLTAYPIAVTNPQLTHGYVLITAATSTVGHAAIQIAQARGLEVIGTTRSAAKAKLLKEETGIENVIVSGQDDFVKSIQQMTNGHGIDIAFDPIFGQTITELADAMAMGGHIIEYGVIAGMEAPMPVPQLLGKGLTIKGYSVSEVVDHSEIRQTASQYVLDHITAGDFTPLIAKEFPLADFKAAFDQLAKNDLLGRVILTMDK